MSDFAASAAPDTTDLAATRVAAAAATAAAVFAAPAAALPVPAATAAAPNGDAAPDADLLRRAYRLMHTAAAMASLYEAEKAVAARYVHATARGHEAVQLAAAFLLKETDFAAPYYRDDALLLGLGLRPYELMLQLLAKADDPFSGGRTYYAHSSLRRAGIPVMPHQSSATGMQAIPATGMAHAIKYLESQKIKIKSEELKSEKFATFKSNPLVLCSIGDGAMTEGEVAEALQMAVLHQLPIVYLVQDNDWGISATGREMRAMNAYEFAAGFPGLRRMQVDGANFGASHQGLTEAFAHVRARRGPVLVHAKCPLLGHHTSGVRREWYRTDLTTHQEQDPLPRLHQQLLEGGFSAEELDGLQVKPRPLCEPTGNSLWPRPTPTPPPLPTTNFRPPS